MSAVRKIIVFASLTALIAMMSLIGCEPDRSGTAIENSAPIVTIVNTPPDGAEFSRNPELNWFATDIDGYIAFFRYAVIVDSMLEIGGTPVTPEVFIAQAGANAFDWDTLTVDLDHPQSSATIRLFADTLDPANTFVSQYFFVQACDDQGLFSDIAFRLYSRNNNYPNTHHRSGALFINAVDANSAANGISVNWYGADSTDWGRTEPPLEYEWRIFGPFAADADIYVKEIKEDCIYDPIGDSLTNCRTVYILDLDAIPDTIYIDPGGGQAPVAKGQPLATSQGANYAMDSTDTWVTETETTIYNVFSGMNLQETSLYKFVFWVRARDDGFVPDPSPAFSQFNVVEALFERDIAVIDDGYYSRTAGRWTPRSLDIVKDMFSTYIEGAGYTDFDVNTDMYWRAGQTDYFAGTTTLGREFQILDALSHKVLIYHTDFQVGGVDVTPSTKMQRVYLGMDQGATSWVISRNIAGVDRDPVVAGDLWPMPIEFQLYYGIVAVGVEAFNYWTFAPDHIHNPVFLEEFIGAYPVSTTFPQIDLLYSDSAAGRPTSRLDSMYVLWEEFIGTSHEMHGLPMVGVCNKTPIASPVYLYYSRFGESSVFHGKVCGVRASANDTRTACFLFTPLAMDPEPMQETFTITLDWLMEKFSSASGAAKPGVGTTANSTSLYERKQRTQEYLDYLNEFATPEELEQLGVAIKPFVTQ